MTNKKLKTTFMMTSLAILFATISVATTLTLVHANLEGNDVNISVSPAATPANVIAAVGDPPEYSGTIGEDAVLEFLDDDEFSQDIDADLSEITIVNPGINVDDGSFSFPAQTQNGVVDWNDTNGDRSVQFDELTLGTAGIDVDDNGQATRTATLNPIEVDIDSTDEVWITMPNGPGTIEDIIVEIDDLSWDPENGAIGSVECGTSDGTNTDATFDEDTLKFNMTSHIGLIFPIGVHCEFEAFHGDVEKEIIDCDDIPIKNDTTTECTFSISYSGANATIIDTVPAEWQVLSINSDSIDAELAFVDGSNGGTSDGEIDVSKVELTIIDRGANVPDGTFTFSAGTQNGTVDFVDSNGDKSVQMNELTVNLQGVDVNNESAFITADASGNCIVYSDGKNKKTNMKSATGIECTAIDEDVFAVVTIETRESPDTKKHENKDPKFKPTSCGEFFLNDGAQAILLDDSGEPVLSSLDGLPIILDETDPLSVDAIENIALGFECEVDPI
jgi:hypothetical protein